LDFRNEVHGRLSSHHTGRGDAAEMDYEELIAETIDLPDIPGFFLITSPVNGCYSETRFSEECFTVIEDGNYK